MLTRGFCCKCSKLLLNEDIICNKCYTEFLKMLSTYLKEHRWSNMRDISYNTKIPIKVLELFIKNEDLQEVEQDDLSKAIAEYERLVNEEAQRQKNLELLKQMSSLTKGEDKEDNSNSGPRMRYYGISSDSRRKR